MQSLVWVAMGVLSAFFFSSRRRHTRYWRDWSSDVCSSDLVAAALLAALIAITAIDLQLQIIPNAITLPGIVAGVLANLGTGAVSWRDAVIGVLVGGGVFVAIMLGYALVFREEGMGLGDAKLGAMLGAFLGWRALFFSLFVAVTVGVVLAIVLLATGQRGRKHP